jgi:hypothetical protein
VDQPAHALLVHRKRKIATLVVRGTTTLNDVVTDLRAIPVPFPEEGWGGVQNGKGDAGCTSSDEEEIDWVKMGHDGNKGQALMGMAKVRAEGDGTMPANKTNSNSNLTPFCQRFAPPGSPPLISSTRTSALSPR